ncbi:MAG: PKD domain-containing protein, partial [Prevotellaceae bacterium]|nr:PKD domain-containing protein [Prevotellaceae bacterium]
MKKFTLFFGMLLCATMVWAEGVGNMVVTFKVNGNPYSKYNVGSENWGDNVLCADLQDLPNIAGYNFDSPTSLILDGAISISWGDVPANQQFLQYRIYKDGTVAGGATISYLYFSEPDVWDATNSCCINNRRYELYDANVDVLAAAFNIGGYGTYHIDIEMKSRANGGDAWTGFKTATFSISNPAEFSVDNDLIQNIGLTGIEYDFTALTADAGSYEWKINDNSVSNNTGEIFSYIFSTAGTYTVKLTVDGTDFTEKTVKIFEKSAVQNKIVYNGWETILESHPTTPVNLSSNEWISPCVHISGTSGDNSRIMFYQPVYLLAAKTYTFNCDITTTSVSGASVQLYVTETDVPVDNQTFVIDGGVGIINENSAIGQIRTSGWGGQWTTGSGTFQDYTANSCSFTPATSGMYFLILRQASWYSNFDFTLCNLVFSAPDDNPTSISNIAENEVSVFTDKGFVSATFNGEANIQIFTLQGQILKTFAAN